MFRFTIRDLLWLMVVAALASAWWMDRYRAELARDRDTQLLLQQEGLLDSIERFLTIPTANPDELRRLVNNERKNVRRLAELWQESAPPILTPGDETPEHLSPVPQR